MTQDAEGNTAKWLLQHRWTGPPTLTQGSTLSEKRGRGTSSTTFTTRLCPNKKLPTGAPKTRFIRLLDAAKGSVQQVQRWVRGRDRLATPATTVQMWPRNVQQQWQAACDRLRELEQLGALPSSVQLQDLNKTGTSEDLKILGAS